KRPYEKYFLRETDRIIIKQPLDATNNMNKYDVVANISGGGLTGQAGALRLGISRALLTIDPAFKDLLRKQGYLTRDPRAKERKKYGQKGARKRFQWTKR
ncbi:MAG: 30S ribosomal protein S9, partial [Candidatus Omnitrophica bacterium]|nr:30S ribosomal protein S9 [Candidatus Omnitrophota bacterium]